MIEHPLQPIYTDGTTLRFKANAIVVFLLENGGYNMNKLAGMNFSNEDREQFAQLIGYSLSGFGELSYVSDEAYQTASRMAESGENEQVARNNHLRETLDELRESLRKPMAKLFELHEDNLKR